jgi:adenosylcobinamide kinase / adenosylcobinamide-phosphate guanylyltransferase
MGKIVLITGGARSGKSTYAEELAKSFGQKVMYIATSIAFDDEMKDRIKKHKDRRPSSWNTYEGYRDLKLVYKTKETFEVILLDCITVMISNLIYDYIGEEVDNLKEEDINEIEKSIMMELSNFIDEAALNRQTVIIVTNELGCGIVPEYKLGRIFRDIAGRANQYIASRAEEVYLTVCGIPMKIK